MEPVVEQFTLPPTSYVPNSRFPVMVYRNVLNLDPSVNAVTKESITEQIEANHWLIGGVFKAVNTHHFHSVTHEVYGVFRGKSRYLLGRGPLDPEEEMGEDSIALKYGREIEVQVGDVLVVPAGVSHCNLTSEGSFEYVGLYPKGSPKWNMNWCKANPDDTEKAALEAYKVPIPEHDPVYGVDGPLPRIWRDIDSKLH